MLLSRQTDSHCIGKVIVVDGGSAQYRKHISIEVMETVKGRRRETLFTLYAEGSSVLYAM